jgi:hypothetical protein
MLRALSAIPVVAFFAFQVYWGYYVPKQYGLYDKPGRSSSDSSSSGLFGRGPWRAVGLSEEAAMQEVASGLRRFQPTQSCTSEMMEAAQEELEKGDAKFSANGKYRLWVHMNVIERYEAANRDRLMQVERAYNRRDAVAPIECEKTVTALAIARRG